MPEGFGAEHEAVLPVGEGVEDEEHGVGVVQQGVSDGLPVHDATGLRVPEPGAHVERLVGVEDADLRGLRGGGPVPRDPLYEVPEHLRALPRLLVQPPIHHGGVVNPNGAGRREGGARPRLVVPGLGLDRMRREKRKSRPGPRPGSRR